MKIHYLLFLPALCFTSCATITRGVNDKLTVKSEPSGADAKLSTNEHGVTPAVFVKPRRGNPFTVTVSKPGYIPQTVRIESHLSATGFGATLGNAAIGGLIGVVADSASGATYSLYPNPVDIHLVPLDGSSTKAKTKSTTTTTATPTPTPHR